MVDTLQGGRNLDDTVGDTNDSSVDERASAIGLKPYPVRVARIRPGRLDHCPRGYFGTVGKPEISDPAWSYLTTLRDRGRQITIPLDR